MSSSPAATSTSAALRALSNPCVCRLSGQSPVMAPTNDTVGGRLRALGQSTCHDRSSDRPHHHRVKGWTSAPSPTTCGCSRTGRICPVMAVVKADGYGHGAVQVARAALAAGAAELGVATLDEALALRRDGITAPVLSWLHPPGTDFAPALLADVELGGVLGARARRGASTPSSAPAGPRRSPSRWTPV